MIRTGAGDLDSTRDGGEVRGDGKRVHGVAAHPAFAPVVDVRARIHDIAREARYCGLMSDEDAASGEGQRVRAEAAVFGLGDPLDFVSKAAGLSDRVMGSG